MFALSLQGMNLMTSKFTEADAACLCEAAAGGKLGLGTKVTEVTLWDVQVMLAYRWNDDEHARRQAASAGPLDDLWLLDALLKLPVGRTVALTSLAGRDRRLLERGEPVQACERRAEMVVRWAVPPLSVDLAVVRSEHTGPEALDVMPFGAYVPQAIWLDAPMDGSGQLQAEAARYSTGVVHWQGADEPRVLVPVQPLAEAHETAAGWQFAEHAYARLLGDPAGLGLVSPLGSPTG
ncbi:hypothetical protein QF026_000078 [Streptomyces aurantiacus]|uniref:hypothetical protein n=1 Tax=Streptomyces aurantiacus TaxID=47760 RepID=UPI00278F9696|nr:hypothetical protein [Streptomyces aurantiacus]MDQ0771612.1 hypothetical protein [Streptomyces aurantiacus]